MRLGFAGTSEIAAPQDRVWAHLMDPGFIASCTPEVERVDSVDDTHYKVTSGIGIGGIRFRLHLDVTLSDLGPPTSARMDMRGTPAGSSLRILTTIRLAAIDERHTRLTWSAEADVRGIMAMAGTRLLRAAAGALTSTFWKKFAERAGAGR